MSTYVYSWCEDRKTDRSCNSPTLLGKKGANLASMAERGLRIPPGFTVTTQACSLYQEQGFLSEQIKLEILDHMKSIEREIGKQLGGENPLLISVRSGAPVSMPGMMETILNLGLNNFTVSKLIEKTGNAFFVYDSYRRFIHMYATVVLGVESSLFEKKLTTIREAYNLPQDSFLRSVKDISILEHLVDEYKKIVLEHTGKPFPEDVYEQLWGAVCAIFDSWNLNRAIVYRKVNRISESLGTAATIMAMVFGNTGENSGSGVLFTRDPTTGENITFGEFLINAQGEDIVNGTINPSSIDVFQDKFSVCYRELVSVGKNLEAYYRDMQDIEFTIEDGVLWILQCRSGKRTGIAALRIAVDMVQEGLISEEEALLRVKPSQLEQFLKPLFDKKSKRVALRSGNLLGRGMTASPGAISGCIALSVDKVVEFHRKNEPVVFVCLETSPEDIVGMVYADGILTANGGITSHASLVARQLGKVCVVGMSSLHIDLENARIEVNGSTLNEGDTISIDGSSGEVIRGDVKTLDSEVLQVLVKKNLLEHQSVIYTYYKKFMNWVQSRVQLKVYSNADNAEQCERALCFGASGIGLCRTEHMFFETERIRVFRRLILSDSDQERSSILEELYAIQRSDFLKMFRVMGEFPIVVRLLDPPFHEFLPHDESAIMELKDSLGLTQEELKHKYSKVKEMNPMLGHRGCRLSIVYQDIAEMQVRALVEAACEVKKSSGLYPKRLYILVPLISDVAELKAQKFVIESVADSIMRSYNIYIPISIGAMIEVPRAVLTADQIAKEAEFFSFGTNDLTQTTYGISRDDMGRFVPYYLEKNIFSYNPFETIDIEGVGTLMRLAVEKGREVRPELIVSVCGEHGGDARSVEFFSDIDVDYISCSAFRIPLAQLSAVQSDLKKQ